MDKDYIRKRLAIGCLSGSRECMSDYMEGCERAFLACEQAAPAENHLVLSGSKDLLPSVVAKRQDSPQPGVPAAVLIGLINRLEGLSIVLTKRTAHLAHHPGQISFPGGHTEPDDAGPQAAALREAFEEIGLSPSSVEILGCLPDYYTMSNFRVTPVVGWIESDPSLTYRLDPHEVSEVFEVPLDFVLNSENHFREQSERNGKPHSYFVFTYPGYRIWGVTAGILVCLARILSL